MFNVKQRLNFIYRNTNTIIIFLLVIGVGIMSMYYSPSKKDYNSYEIEEAMPHALTQDFVQGFAEMSRGSPVMAQKVMMAESSAIMSDAVASPSVERKIQETFDVSVLGPNKDVKKVYNDIISLCGNKFCEIENSNLYTGGDQYSGSIRFKVDHTYLDSFFSKSDAIYGDLSFSITSKSRSSQDRTSQFEDIKARREAQVVLRDRLNKLVSDYSGRDIRSLLEIERELARVQGQIESMDAQMRSISFVTDRATVNVNISGKVEYSPRPTQSAIMKAINDAYGIMEKNIANMIRIASALLPWIALSLFIILGIKIYRRIFK